MKSDKDLGHEVTTDLSKVDLQGGSTNTAGVLAMATLIGASALFAEAVEAKKPASEPAVSGQTPGKAESDLKSPQFKIAEPIHVSSAAEALEQWQPVGQVFVKGDLKKMYLNEERLKQLAGWLSQYPNWTLYIAEDARGEKYRNLTDMDAIETAFGEGVRNTAGYSKLVDPKTGLNTGCFIFLVFDKRYGENGAISYIGSDLHDKYGVGNPAWDNGTLKKPFGAAFRDGFRVADGLQNTVANIEDGLKSAIKSEIDRIAAKEKAAKDAEVAAQKRAAEEKARTIEGAKAAVGSAGETFALLQTRLIDFGKSYPKLSGDIAHPNLDPLKASLAEAKTAFQNENYGAASTAAGGVKAGAEVMIRAMDEYPKASVRFENIAKELQALSKHPFASASSAQAKEAAENAKEAKEAWERGDSEYKTLLGNAERATKFAAEKSDSAQREDQERREAEAARERTLTIFGLLGFLGLGGLLGGLNVSVRRARAKVKEELALREKALGEKVDSLFELEGQTKSVLGESKEKVIFEGKTGQAAGEVLRDVGELFVRASAVEHVLWAARKELGQGIFSKSNVAKASRMLKDEPVTFDPESGIEIVVRGEKREIEDLWAEVSSFKPFEMSFEDLMEDFNTRAKRAYETLETIRHADQSAGVEIAGMISQIKEARPKLSAMGQEASVDGLLAISAEATKAFDKWEKKLNEALTRATRDPLAAADEVSELRRPFARVAEVLEVVGGARAKLFPELKNRMELLSANKVELDWVNFELETLNRDLTRYLADQHSDTPPADRFPVDERLGEILKQLYVASELLQKRNSSFTPALNKTDEEIESTRAEFSTKLGLKKEQILVEKDSNPTEIQSEARESEEQFIKHLSDGYLEKAQEALDTALRLNQEAAMVVTNTRKAFELQDQNLRALREETADINSKVPEFEAMLSNLKDKYDPAALLLGTGDETHPRANGTVGDNIAEAREALSEAKEAMDKAEKIFAQGRVLEAAMLLQQALEINDFAMDRLEEVKDKHERIAETIVSNSEKLAELSKVVGQLEPELSDSRVISSTMDSFKIAQRALIEANKSHAQEKGNPLATEQEIQGVITSFKRVDRAIASDRELYAEAERSIGLAGKNLEAAAKTLRVASEDQVADSPEILTARGELQKLNQRLGLVQKSIKQPHSEWREIDREADAIFSEAAHANSVLGREIEEAQEAVKKYQSASSKVKSAKSWDGDYGVEISGSYGTAELQRAQEALASGNYENTIALASKAFSSAAGAISRAEREVEEARQAEAARKAAEAAARRAREAAYERSRSSSYSSSFGSSSRSSSFGSSSFSSGRSSFGGGSSGSSRSSFGGGSSGASRSSF